MATSILADLISKSPLIQRTVCAPSLSLSIAFDTFVTVARGFELIHTTI